MPKLSHFCTVKALWTGAYIFKCTDWDQSDLIKMQEEITPLYYNNWYKIVYCMIHPTCATQLWRRDTYMATTITRSSASTFWKLLSHFITNLSHIREYTLFYIIFTRCTFLAGLKGFVNLSIIMKLENCAWD